MIKEQKFQRNRSESPRELVFGLVTSILLHSMLFFIGNKYWLQTFAPERQQELSQPIPIEFVEVPLDEKKPPPETSRRAANDSVAGGEAKPDRPVSIAKSAPAAVPKASASSPTDFPAPKAAKLFPPKPRQPVAVSPPDLSLQRPQPEPPKPVTAPATTRPKPEQQKIVAALRATPPKPKPQITATPPVPTQLKPEQQKIVAALRATKQKLETPKTAAAPTITQPKPKLQTPATSPTTIQPKPSSRQENENLRPAEFTSKQLKPKVTPRKPSPAQQPSKLGEASRLGGPISLSSRNFGGDPLAALPNSTRSNQGTQGIDARQDVDLGPYLEQLQQRVRQQWMPGLVQSSWQTVVYFSVSRSGQVSNLRIARSSGDSATDEAALSAVKRATPFAPLPTEYTEDYINIRFTFNINTYGALDPQL